jgi:hypothetical protein
MENGGTEDAPRGDGPSLKVFPDTNFGPGYYVKKDHSFP